MGRKPAVCTMGGAIIRRFALFPLMLLMLLLLPAGMVAQTSASSSKYIATYDSDTETLTFEKYEGESLPSESESEWVEDGKSVFEMFGSSNLRDIKHIVINESFKTFTPTTLSSFFAALSELETITGLEYLNTANVTDMSSLFDHCQKLTSLDLSNFNTAKVTNMNRMFSNCSNLKAIYASDKFTTAAVTESKNMFSYCGSLSGDIDWTSDKATDKTYAKTGGGYFRDKAYDNRPYVKYADGTLTFRWGYKKILGENEYLLNSDEKLPKWKTHSSKISKVVFEASFANARPTTCYAWFKNFTFLNQIEGIENLNTENVKDMSEMFYDCSGLISLDVTHFNTENVTSMGSMFNSCRGLTSLDVTHFNTENVTSMNGMFYGCRGLISLDVTHFNTANVKSMSFMFSWCNKLKEIYVSDKFVTDDVISSTYMFSYCGSLSGDIDWTSDKATDKTYAKTDGGYFRDKAYDNRPWVKYADGTLTFRCGYKKTLGENEYELNSGKNQPKWETNYNNISQVVFEASFANARPKSCYAWFQNFENLKQIEGIENLNTENVTSMAYMFSSCNKLAELDVTHFNTANVTDMSYMFLGCKKLTSLDVTKFNTAKVTNMNGMFSSCSSLTSLDVTNFNTANVTVMGSMFRNCSALTSLDVTNFNTEKVTYMVHMFSGCRALTSLDVTKFNTANVANMSNMFYNCSSLTSLDVTKFNTEKVTNMSNMFYYCLKLTSLDVTKFNTEKVTDMSNMFYNCSKLTSLNVTNFNTAKVTDMRYMFYGCSSLTSLDVTKFNTEKVTNMSYMFYNCSELISLNVTNFNTAKVTDMRSMFMICSGLKSLDVTNFDTGNVISMAYMFYGCSALTSLDLTNFNTAKVTDMCFMFKKCSGLTSLDLTKFNTAEVTDMRQMFHECSALTTIYASDEFVTTNVETGSNMFFNCIKLKGFIEYNKNTDKDKDNYKYANYKTGYFCKLVGKNGDEKIGAAGEPLATDNLVLDDGKDFVANEPFAAKAASYSRTVEGTTWATLCLPFEVSLVNQNFRAFKLLSADEGTETVELEEIKTRIEAGTPVIIKMKDGATKLDFTVADKEIANEVKTAETSNGNYQLQGLYTQKEFSKDTDNNCYIVKGDKLMNPAKLLGETATKSVGSKPFRAYMADNSSAPAAGARMFSISIGGSTTAIEQLETTADSKAEYYDLQGRRLQNLQKGVNIVKRGGKTMKVIIK